jgi:preprotein translocase subunit SecD
MCLKGILSGGKPTDPGTFEEFRDKALAQGGDETRVTRADYDTALKAWESSDESKSQKENESEETEIEAAEKTEAQKTAEAKEKAMEEKIATVTAPVSTMEADDPARKRQMETMVSISSPSKKRSRSKGRRSLITGKSGGGIGYYSKFFT